MPATGSDEAAGFNRKLIYRANLVMPVEDYSKAQTALRDLVALSGAYILQFSENANTGERGGTYTIKVAANGFVSLLDGLEKMSPSLQRNVQGQDVTEEYVDLSSRLKANNWLKPDYSVLWRRLPRRMICLHSQMSYPRCKKQLNRLRVE